MKKLLLALMLCLPVAAQAQQPIKIRTTEVADSTRYTITWTAVAGATTYDVLTFSNPRNLYLEQLRVVTGTTWTITAPRAAVADSTRFYVNVRQSNPTKYAAITYRTPPQN
jgi:predicted peptidase